MDEVGLREETIAAFCLAAHCERWEFKDERAHEFFDLLDKYIADRIITMLEDGGYIKASPETASQPK